MRRSRTRGPDRTVTRASDLAQMDLAGGGLDSDAGHIQGVVRAVHAALGRGFLVLLNGHDRLLVLNKGW